MVLFTQRGKKIKGDEIKGDADKNGDVDVKYE